MRNIINDYSLSTFSSITIAIRPTRMFSKNLVKVFNVFTLFNNSNIVILMDTESGLPGTCWVDKAYADYPYKKECMFNCYISVDLLNDEFNLQKKDLDYADIEDYFTTQLREVSVCHIVARITTDNGIAIELYADDVERIIQKLNEIESDKNRLVNFNCEIYDDESWDNVSNLLIEEE